MPAEASLLLTPTPPSIINKSHCLCEVVIVGPRSETRENSRVRSCQGERVRASRVSGVGLEEKKIKSRNSTHSPLVFSRFLKRQLLGWSKKRRNQRGNWSHGPEEENSILQGTRHLTHTHTRIERLTLEPCFFFTVKVYNRLCFRPCSFFSIWRCVTHQEKCTLTQQHKLFVTVLKMSLQVQNNVADTIGFCQFFYICNLFELFLLRLFIFSGLNVLRFLLNCGYISVSI